MRPPIRRKARVALDCAQDGRLRHDLDAVDDHDRHAQVNMKDAPAATSAVGERPYPLAGTTACHVLQSMVATPCVHGREKTPGGASTQAPRGSPTSHRNSSRQLVVSLGQPNP